jgi:hypothetical protein
VGEWTQVDAARNLIYVKGQVPGHKGNFVYLKDADRKTVDKEVAPFPTALLAEGQAWADVPAVTAKARKNHFDQYNRIGSVE